MNTEFDRNLSKEPIDESANSAQNSAPMAVNQHAEFPVAETNLNVAFANDAVLLNGMKVLFDETVPVQLVNIISKDKPSSRSRYQV